MPSATIVLGEAGQQITVTVRIDDPPAAGVQVVVDARGEQVYGAGALILQRSVEPEEWALVPLESPPEGGGVEALAAAAAEARDAPRPSVAPRARAVAALGAASSGSGGPAPASLPLVPKAASAAAPKAAPAACGGWARYYVVVAAPAGFQGLVGIWRTAWAPLEGRLPGGRFPGSRVRLWGYDTYDEACARWINEREDPPPPYQ